MVSQSQYSWSHGPDLTPWTRTWSRLPGCYSPPSESSDNQDTNELTSPLHRSVTCASPVPADLEALERLCVNGFGLGCWCSAGCGSELRQTGIGAIWALCFPVPFAPCALQFDAKIRSCNDFRLFLIPSSCEDGHEKKTFLGPCFPFERGQKLRNFSTSFFLASMCNVYAGQLVVRLNDLFRRK